MSTTLYICSRKTGEPVLSPDDTMIISKALEPDNITYPSPKVLESKNTTAVLINPNELINLHDTSTCLGCMIKPESTWWAPSSPTPDGSYALFRNDEKRLELITDVVASRTIWYYFDDNLFIASTSQRAIVILLKSFRFNKDVISWMLATGTLGPGFSWDRRIKNIKADSSVSLNKESWVLTHQNNEIKFNDTYKTKKECKNALQSAVRETLESIEVDFSKWVLPLSGGHDSRTLLCMLKNNNKLKCVTWGLESSLKNEKNDAYIAKKLAEHFGLDHKYLLTEITDEPIKDVLDRFLACGEGRIDQISGYTDGFMIWKLLFENGVDGIIRGDQAFGYVPVTSELDVRLSVGCSLLSDYSNLEFMLSMGIEKQKFPQWLNRKKDESCATYRDRLYQQYRHPYFMASLSDLKLSYVELCNPLLSKKIISMVRKIPDKLRTSKSLHKEIVEEISPNIAYAEFPAIGYIEDILQSKKIVDVITDELNSEYCADIFRRDFLSTIINKIHLSNTSNAKSKLLFINKIELMKLAKKILPRKFKKMIMNLWMKPQLDPHVLAFRVYIVCVMYKMLTKDAESLE